jgi:hypothetical protein
VGDARGHVAAVVATALLAVHCGGANSGAADAGTIVLLAYGGAPGEVAADVAAVEPGAGQAATCATPLGAGSCRLCQLAGALDILLGGYGNFGPISVSVGTTTVPLTYAGIGYGTVDFPSSIALGTGGIMTFRGGNGAGVPIFDVSAIIPGLAVVTSPAPAVDGGALAVDTSQDLSVTWVPITIGQIQLVLSVGLSVQGASIACTFDGAGGSGTVPHGLLSTLKAMSMPDAGPAYVSLSSQNEATTVIDGLTIVTESYQDSPTSGRAVTVTLR